MSLIEVVIAFGLLSVAVFASISAFYQSNRLSSAVARLGELNDLRSFVKGNVSCKATLAAVTPCPAPVAPQTISVIPGRSPSNAVVIPAPSMLFAIYHKVRVGCRPGESRLYVQVQTPDSTTRYLADWHSLYWVPIDCP